LDYPILLLDLQYFMLVAEADQLALVAVPVEQP
jgi:hypothetical protein